MRTRKMIAYYCLPLALGAAVALLDCDDGDPIDDDPDAGEGADDGGVGGDDGGVGGDDGGTGGEGGSDDCERATARLHAILTLPPGFLGSPREAGNSFTGSNGTSTTNSEGYTDVTCTGEAILPDTDINWGGLSCGAGADSHVVCPLGFTHRDAGDGDHLVLMMGFAADVPLDHAVELYQYAFVFDSDGDPANNYTPAPQWPNDFFKDTDLWVEANYDPAGGWTARVSDVVSNTPQPRSTSQAKIYVSGNAIALIVPVTDLFGSASYPGATYRVTAFRHEGAFLAGPWNGDTVPLVDDPLLPVPQP